VLHHNPSQHEKPGAEENKHMASSQLNDDSPMSPARRQEDKTILGLEVSEVLSKLRECRGSRRAAAVELGISERKLYRMLKRIEELGMAVPRPYQ